MYLYYFPRIKSCPVQHTSPAIPSPARPPPFLNDHNAASSPIYPCRVCAPCPFIRNVLAEDFGFHFRLPHFLSDAEILLRCFHHLIQIAFYFSRQRLVITPRQRQTTEQGDQPEREHDPQIVDGAVFDRMWHPRNGDLGTRRRTEDEMIWEFDKTVPRRTMG